MSAQSPRIIWLIDEDERQLRTYHSLLEDSLPAGSGVSVEPILALPKMEDYVPLLSRSDTAAFIVDQRLRETGVADYTGVELASFLRGISDILPVYILTNFADSKDEFTQGEWNVDGIIPKKDIANARRRTVALSRMLRHLGAFQAISGSREERFRSLLRRSLSEELTPEEWKELEDLRFLRSTAVLAEELPRLKELQDLLRRVRNGSSTPLT